MELNGQQRIAAPRQRVWEALNDSRVLKACIPGCESMTPDGDSAFDAVVRAKVGPVRATFTGRVELSDVRPPERCTINGQGKGGAAGVAKGRAEVFLSEDGDGTLLNYAVSADVGGKLAQVGSRLVQSSANKYATDFFARFGDIVTGAVPIEVPLPETADLAEKAGIEKAGGEGLAAGDEKAAPRPAPDANTRHLRRLNWALFALVCVLIAYILATH